MLCASYLVQYQEKVLQQKFKHVGKMKNLLELANLFSKQNLEIALEKIQQWYVGRVVWNKSKSWPQLIKNYISKTGKNRILKWVFEMQSLHIHFSKEDFNFHMLFSLYLSNTEHLWKYSWFCALQIIIFCIKKPTCSLVRPFSLIHVHFCHTTSRTERQKDS